MELTTDIVELLRLHDADESPEQDLMNQAADEIERLRGVLRNIRDFGKMDQSGLDTYAGTLAAEALSPPFRADAREG